MINRLDQLAKLPRSKKIKGVILASLMAGAMALPFVLPPQKAHAQNGPSWQAGDSDALLGTWIVQVSLDPNTVPPGTPPSILNFTALDTFGAGGGYVASNNGPGAGGQPVQGNWVRTGRHQFAETGLRFSFDTAQKFTLLNRVRSTLTLSERGDEFTENIQTDMFLPDGTLLPIHPAGTSHGTRVAIEPLN